MKTYSCFLGIICIVAFGGCAVQTPVVGTKAGNLAPEISAPDASGNILTLSSLRGKYVLIEFWQSENNQSRKNHFEMGRLYQKYRDADFKDGEGFDIFSLSIDNEKNKWLSALREDVVVWPAQVIDTSSWGSKTLLEYSVASLPKYYLLDEKGVILRHNIIITELEDILKSYIN